MNSFKYNFHHLLIIQVLSSLCHPKAVIIGSSWQLNNIRASFLCQINSKWWEGSLMTLASVIAKHAHKHVTEVQSHRGLIRDRRNKMSVYKLNMSATSDGSPSQSHCLLYKSSKIKMMICCQELNLLHSPLQFKTPATQISVIISQTSSHKHCINIKGSLCSMRDYLYSQWQLTHIQHLFSTHFPFSKCIKAALEKSWPSFVITVGQDAMRLFTNQ